MQRGRIDGLRKRLQQISQVQGLPGIDGTLGRFIGYTTTGAPVVTDQNMVKKGDWVLSQDAHVWIAVTFFGGQWIWQDTFTVALGQILTSKGDLVAGTGSGNFSRLGKGANGTALTALTSEATGLIYANPRSGRDAYYERTSGVGETMPRYLAQDDIASITSGTLSLQAIYLPKGAVITSIGFKSGATAANTPTNWWFALLSGVATPIFLRSTANQLTTAWAANTEKVVALSSAYTTLSEGLFYLGFCMAATATCSLWGKTVSTSGPQAGVPILCGTGTTGMTVPVADGTASAAIAVGAGFRWGSTV